MDFSHYVFGRVGEQDTVHIVSIQVTVLITQICFNYHNLHLKCFLHFKDDTRFHLMHISAYSLRVKMTDGI